MKEIGRGLAHMGMGINLLHPERSYIIVSDPPRKAKSSIAPVAKAAAVVMATVFATVGVSIGLPSVGLRSLVPHAGIVIGAVGYATWVMWK